MAKTAKITISMDVELISLADKVAKEKKTSRSKVLAQCLQELAEKRLNEEMAEGYKAMAKEHQEFAEMAFKIAHETLPEWK